MFQPLMITNKQENFHFPGWGINQRTLTICAVYLVHHPHTLLTHVINI